MSLYQVGANIVSLIGNLGRVGIDIGGSQVAVLQLAGGTVTLNDSTPVTVANTNVTANSVIIFTLKTPGGSVGAYPTIETITPGVGFTVEGGASDVSVYNYVIVG